MVIAIRVHEGRGRAMALTESKASRHIGPGLAIVLMVAVGLSVACRSEPWVALQARSSIPPIALPSAVAAASEPTQARAWETAWVRKPVPRNPEEERKAMENPAAVILGGLMVLALIIGVAAILAVIGAGGVGLLGGTLFFLRRLAGREHRDEAEVTSAVPRSEGR